MTTDLDLVLRAKRGDAEAWRLLYERYFPLVWRYANTQVEEVHLAEDIVSETMLALLKGLGSIEGEAARISAWLRSVVRHKVADHHRRAYRLRDRLSQVSAQAESREHDQCPSTDMESKETRGQVKDVLDSLSERQRIVLEWKYGEGLRVKEIASRLGETEKAVEATLYRARREFRKKFQVADPTICERSREGTNSR